MILRAQKDGEQAAGGRGSREEAGGRTEAGPCLGPECGALEFGVFSEAWRLI